MANQKQNKEGRVGGKALGIGAGIAVLAAGAAAAYFLYGKDGAKNRKKVKAWMVQAKAEVLNRMEEMKEVNQKVYEQVVDAVAKQYQSAKKIDAGDIARFSGELKRYWKDIERHLPQNEKKAPPARRTRKTKNA